MRLAAFLSFALILGAQTPAITPSTAPGGSGAPPSGTAATPSTTAAPVSEADKVRLDLERARKTLSDWPNIGRYAADNQKVQPPAAGEQRVVFMGDSITDGWGRRYGKFFPGKPYINRGISGQTTSQMLVRFRPDVIALKPQAVVILAGTNDIAGNTGPYSFETTKNNFMSMIDLAKANNIKVILATVMPVDDYHVNQTTRRPPERILELNAWLKQYAQQNGLTVVDYFSAMVDEKGWMKKELTSDGLHPHDQGYEVIQPLAEKAIAQALGTRAGQ